MKNTIFTAVLTGAMISLVSAQDVFQPEPVVPVEVESVQVTTNTSPDVTVSTETTIATESVTTVSESPATSTTPDPAASSTALDIFDTPTVPATEGTTTVSPASTSATTNAPAASVKKEKIVIEYVDQDLSAVLRGLARRAGTNLVIGPGVTGTVTIRLTDVSFEDAIKIIVGAQGLSYTKDEVMNVSYVRTAAAAVQEPTSPDSFTFNYANATEMVPLVRRVLKSGQVPIVDARTNRIFYNEAISNLDNAKKQIAELDMPTKQVMIEAKVMEVNSAIRQSWGINWAGTFQATALQGGLANAAISALPGGNIGIQGLSGAINMLKPQNFSQSFALLTPAQFSATMSFFNTDGETKLLATPKLVVMDNRQATINVETVQNITYAVAAPPGATTSSVAPPPFDAVAGSKLAIAPRINNRNFITMKVTPTVTSFRPPAGAAPDTPVQIVPVADQPIAAIINPIVSTSTLETEVYIKSGNTLAIGGLSRGDQQKNYTKVPILGDIPGIGYLFQSRANVRDDKEVLVFVTPTVIWDPSDLRTRGIERKNTGYEPQYNELDIEKQNLYADPDGWRNNAKGAFKLDNPDKSNDIVYDENGAFTDGPPRGSVNYPAWRKKIEAEQKAKQNTKATPAARPQSSNMQTNPNKPTLATRSTTPAKPVAKPAPAAPRPAPEMSLEEQARENFARPGSAEADIAPEQPETLTTDENIPTNVSEQQPANLMKAGAKLAPQPAAE